MAASMPRPSRSTLTMPRSSQSSLSHWTMVRSGMAAGWSGTTASRPGSQMIMPPECWPRWRGKREDGLGRGGGGRGSGGGWGDAGVFEGVGSRMRIGGLRIDDFDWGWWIGDLRRFARGDGLRQMPRDGLRRERSRTFGEAVGDLFGEAEDLGHFAEGGAGAVGDDVGGHGGAAGGVLFEDVLDDGFAAVAGGEVDVDVGPGACGFRRGSARRGARRRWDRRR